jgi:hypothetical protein
MGLPSLLYFRMPLTRHTERTTRYTTPLCQASCGSPRAAPACASAPPGIDANGQRETPGLFVCENVKSFFTHTVTLPRDPKGLEDIPSHGVQDHSADALRYRLTFDEKLPANISGRVTFGSSPLLMR